MSNGHLELAIDWGTFKWAATCVRFADGKRLGRPEPLWIGGQFKEVRMMATWVNDRFVHGYELEQLAQNDKSLKILHHFKLCLYDSPQLSGLQEEVNAILFQLNKDFDTLLVDHLGAIFKQCKEAFACSRVILCQWPFLLCSLLQSDCRTELLQCRRELTVRPA